MLSRIQLFRSRWRRLKLWLRLLVYSAVIVATIAAFWMGATREEGFDVAAGGRGAALSGSLMSLLLLMLCGLFTGQDSGAIHRVHEKTAIQKAEARSFWFVATGCELGVVMAFFAVPAALGMSFDSSQTATLQQSIGRFLFCVALAFIFVPIGSILGQTIWLMTISRLQPPQIIQEILQRSRKPFIPLLTPLMLFVGRRTLAKSVQYQEAQKEK